MFVSDTQEIGTSEYRLSSELCGEKLNSLVWRDSVFRVKPWDISSRVSLGGKWNSRPLNVEHNSRSTRYTLC